MQRNLLGLLKEQRDSKAYISKIDLINHFYSLASALNYLHGRAIIHQNIKAENILFDKDNKAYLTDCGPARNEMEKSQEDGNDLKGEEVSMGLIEFEKENLYAKDVKELGFLFLAMCDPLRNFFEPKEYLNNSTEFLKKRLLNVRTRYGKDLADIISDMTLPEPCNRITAGNFCKRIEENYSDLIPLLENISHSPKSEFLIKEQKSSENHLSFTRAQDINTKKSTKNTTIQEDITPTQILKRSDSIHTIGKGFIFLPWRYTKSSKTLSKYGAIGTKSLNTLKRCTKLGSWHNFKKVGKKIEFGGLDLIQTDNVVRLPNSRPNSATKVQQISRFIRQFPSIKEFQVDFTCDNLTAKDILVFGKGLFRLKYLEKLKVGFTCGQTLCDAGLGLLGLVLKRIKSVEDLHISLNKWTKVTDKGFYYLSNALSRLANLKRLVLEIEEFPEIGENSLDYLGKNLAHMQKLTELDMTFFRCSSISGRQLSTFSKHLSELKGLKKLSVNMKQARGSMNEGLISLSKALLNTTELKELKLNFLSCDIAETGFSCLGETLGHLLQLQTLHLTFGNNDNVTNQGFEAIATSIKKLQLLKSLKLVFFQCDKITDIAICSLAEALSQAYLHELELNFRWCMQITDYGINKLGEAFLNLVHLNRLGLSFDGCRISDAGVSKLGQDLARLEYLDGFKLEVRECKRIQGSGISKLGECLTKLVKLGQVQLNFCGCGGNYRQRFNEGIISLRKAISRLPNVNVDQNTIAPYCES